MDGIVPKFTNKVIKALSTCVLCEQESSSHLKQLPCFHSCCWNCLRRLLKGLKAHQKFKCPECHRELHIPKEGLEGFRDHYFNSKMKQLHQVCTGPPPVCGTCEQLGEDNQSSHFCLKCERHLCDEDARRHLVTPGHAVVPHKEMMSDQHFSYQLASKDAMCNYAFVHAEPQPYKHYCTVCQAMVCQECSVLEHEGHKKIPLKRAGEEHEKDIRGKLAEMQKQVKRKSLYIQDLENTFNTMEEHSEETEKALRKWGEQVKGMIDKLVEENAATVKKHTKIEKEKLGSLLKKEVNNTKSLTTGSKYVETLLEHTSHVDVIQNHKYLVKDMKKTMRLNSRPEEITYRDFTFTHARMDSVERSLIKLIGEVEEVKNEVIVGVGNEIHNFKLVDTWNANASWGAALGSDETVFLVGGESLEAYGLNGKSKGSTNCKGLEDAWNIVDYNELLYISDCDKRRVSLFTRAGAKQKKILLPHVSINHEKNYFREKLGLAVNRCDGEVFATSSLTDAVYRCKANHNQFIPFITKGLDDPSYICVTPLQELVVSNYGSHQIHKYTNEGNLMWKYGSYGSGDGELDSPCGVCTDACGYIFVADYCNHRVHYLSPDGKFICYVHLWEEIKFPRSLVLKHNNLLITTKTLKGVQVNIVACEDR